MVASLPRLRQGRDMIMILNENRLGLQIFVLCLVSCAQQVSSVRERKRSHTAFKFCRITSPFHIVRWSDVRGSYVFETGT